MSRTSVIVTLHDPAELSSVRGQASGLGLEEIQTIPGLGMMKGHIASDRIGALQDLAGVKAVEPEGVIQLPPGDSPIQ